MTETHHCSSLEECSKYIADGFAIVSISKFVSSCARTYTLERGSDWSRFLGEK